MENDLIDLSQEELFTWGECPICHVKDGEHCISAVGIALGTNIEGKLPEDGAHLARLRHAPSKATKPERELHFFRALRNNPAYSYAGQFPINRAAIESRNQEIDTLRDQLSNVTSRAMRNVMDERIRQDEKWGEQNHDPYTYLTILMEEVGEYAQVCLQTQFGGNKGGLPPMREEAVQVAAVALAIIECLDRGKWKWPTRGGKDA